MLQLVNLCCKQKNASICIVYSRKSVGIVTECISNYNDTSKHHNCRNDEETLNITYCQSFSNFVKKK